MESFTALGMASSQERVSLANDLTRTDSGNMIMIEHTTDFEMYSSTSAGAIQGYGYEFHSGRPCEILIIK